MARIIKEEMPNPEHPEHPEHPEQVDDYTVEVILNSGLICRFRDVTVEDMREIRRSLGKNADEFEQSVYLAARICTKWGNRDDVTPEQLNKLPLKEFMKISSALESFLA